MTSQTVRGFGLQNGNFSLGLLGHFSWDDHILLHGLQCMMKDLCSRC